VESPRPSGFQDGKYGVGFIFLPVTAGPQSLTKVTYFSHLAIAVQG